MSDFLATRYELLELAGAGAQGSVHRARDRSSGAIVAVKLQSAPTAAPVSVEDEAELLRRVQCEGVVGYRDHGRDGGRAFLVMEWIDGETLQARLRRGPLAPDDALALAATVARALGALHQQGVLHRDLTPANILLAGGDPRRPIILDLGTARDVPRAARPIEAVGTPGYVAPEQAQGRGDLDGRADFFALGCVLFHALSGRPPFVGKNELAVMAKIVLLPSPPLPPPASPDLAALVARLLAKDPAGRPGDAGELLALLAVLARGESLPPPPPPRLTGTEHDILSVVMAARGGLPGDDGAPMTHVLTSDDSDADTQPRLGGLTVRELGPSRIVLTVGGGPSAAAQALRAARLALGLHRNEPRLAVAISTGPGLLALQLPVGDVLDECAQLVRAESERSEAEYERPRVVVGPTTAALLAGEVDLRRDGDRVILHGELPTPPPRREAPLVGRGAELERLLRAWSAARDTPSARLLLLTGPAGSGKSRLARELVAAARARDPDCRVVVAHGDPLRAGSPLALLRDAGVEGALEERLGGALAVPALLVLEDLHWADLPSLRQIAAALSHLADRPLLALATGRPEVHERFGGELADLVHEELVLGELDGDSRRLLAAFLLDAPPGAPGVQRLVDRAGGLPLFLEEMARVVDTVEEPAGAGTLTALVAARLKTLDDGARGLLRAGSVFGERFWLEGALALLGAGVETGPALRALVAADVVHEAPRARYPGQRELVFRHAVLRDAAYSLLPDHDRRTGHRLAAAWLTALGEDDAETLAEHHAAAGDRPAAAVFYQRAAEEALAANDFAAAARLAAAGLACGAADAEGHIRLTLAEMEARNWLLEAGTAQRLGLEVEPLVPPGTIARARLFAEQAIAAAVSGDGAGLERMQARLLEELAPFAGFDEPVAQAHLHAAAFAVIYQAIAGRLAQTDPRLVRLIEELPRARLPAGPQRVWGDVLAARATRALFEGHSERAMDGMSEAADAYELAGASAAATSQRANAGYVALDIGAYAEAERSLRAAIFESDGRTQRSHSLADILNLGRAVLCRGRVDEALEILESGHARVVRADIARYIGTAEMYLADAHQRRGDLRRARELALRAAARVHAWPPLHAPAEALCAQLLLADGEAAEAAARAALALSLIEQHGSAEERESLVRLMVPRTLDAVGRVAEARAALAAARDRLRARAADLSPARRRAFLEDVDENRATLALAGAWGV